MNFTRKDVGYTIYSRLEDAMRTWLREKLLDNYGNNWIDHIPSGIFDKVSEQVEMDEELLYEDPIDLLDEINIPDFKEIVTFRRSYASFISANLMDKNEFENRIDKLYELRNKIAHVKRTFSAIDLDSLIEIAERCIKVFEINDTSLSDTLDTIRLNPETVVVKIPPVFLSDESFEYITIPNNLPSAEYDFDGGFIGRKEELKRVHEYFVEHNYHIVTISGAGGVGKSALARQFCENILSRKEPIFAGIVWISAKQEKLTITGIKSINPTLKTYEDILDSILTTFGWFNDLEKSVSEKEESVNIILRCGDKGVLLVIDNLETIQDDAIFTFLLDFPRESKVLITSRKGLGEMERRYPLKEMSSKDATIFIRTVAREKEIFSLVQQSDTVLREFAERMSRYPLAMKWVIGQIGLGRDINRAIEELDLPDKDVAKFRFEQIFNELLTENAKLVLYTLAMYDKPITWAILSHISNLPDEELEDAKDDLMLASLIVNTQENHDNEMETQYELLPLTQKYIYAKLKSVPRIFEELNQRIEQVKLLREEAKRAVNEYRYSLAYMGAKTEPEQVAAIWCNTAYQRQQDNDYEGAVLAFERAVKTAPRFSSVYRNWAEFESKYGFYERAEELIKEAVKYSPDDPFIWKVWGDIEKKRIRYDRAYEYLSNALDLSKDDTFILSALGDVEKRRGNYSEAYNLLQKALREGPSDVNTRKHELVCMTSLADNLKRWAESLSRQDMLEQAIEKLEEAYALAFNAHQSSKYDKKAYSTFRRVAFELGKLKWISKDLYLAQKYLKEALVENIRGLSSRDKKVNVYACYYLCLALLDTGDIDDALKYYQLGKRSKSRQEDDDILTQLDPDFAQSRYIGNLFRIDEDKKTFGFLKRRQDTYFLHFSDIIPPIDEHDFIEWKDFSFSFIIERDTKGNRARRVRPIINSK